MPLLRLLEVLMMVPSGECAPADRTLLLIARLAFVLCLRAAAIASLNAAFIGWGPRSDVPPCSAVPGDDIRGALLVDLAGLLRGTARFLIGISSLTSIFVAAPLLGLPSIVTPRITAEVSMLGSVPLAVGWLGALIATIGGC